MTLSPTLCLTPCPFRAPEGEGANVGCVFVINNTEE
jgi:hypothetical protein